MPVLKLVRQHDGAVIADRARVADDFLSRLKGLIGRKEFHPGEGLLFPRCNSVHMWFMSIPIDVLFLAKQTSGWEVLSVHPKLTPWKVVPVGNWRAADALELPSGTADRLQIRKGEVLCIAS